jgi:hypothetical protein
MKTIIVILCITFRVFVLELGYSNLILCIYTYNSLWCSYCTVAVLSDLKIFMYVRITIFFHTLVFYSHQRRWRAVAKYSTLISLFISSLLKEAFAD